MKNTGKNTFAARSRTAIGAATALALLGSPLSALADPPVAMAPPIQPASPAYQAPIAPAAAVSAADSSVFNWKEVPQNQKVPLTRAVFDQGGYQLYDTAGETIVVPFTNNNLYVMKFAVSPDGTTSFVNTGAVPVLYIPRGGSLENAAVPGARWYPFTADFHPASPVFLGIAPSWDDYCAMGWYPGIVFYGGYWGYHPWRGVGLGFFTPSIGLTIFFGGHHYDGWDSYARYWHAHPAPYHLRVVNRNIYHEGGHYEASRIDAFRGTGHGYAAGRGVGAAHVGSGRIFNGAGHPLYAHRVLGGDRTFATHQTTGSISSHGVTGGHTFRGTGSSGMAFGAGHSYSGGSASGHTFRGGSAGSVSGHSSGSARSAFQSGGARPSFQGGHSSGGSSYGGHASGRGGSFGAHASGGGGHASGGGGHTNRH